MQQPVREQGPPPYQLRFDEQYFPFAHAKVRPWRRACICFHSLLLRHHRGRCSARKCSERGFYSRFLFLMWKGRLGRCALGSDGKSQGSTSQVAPSTSETKNDCKCSERGFYSRFLFLMWKGRLGRCCPVTFHHFLEL